MAQMEVLLKAGSEPVEATYGSLFVSFMHPPPHSFRNTAPLVVTCHPLRDDPCSIPKQGLLYRGLGGEKRIPWRFLSFVATFVRCGAASCVLARFPNRACSIGILAERRRESHGGSLASDQSVLDAERRRVTLLYPQTEVAL